MGDPHFVLQFYKLSSSFNSTSYLRPSILQAIFVLQFYKLSSSFNSTSYLRPSILQATFVLQFYKLSSSFNSTSYLRPSILQAILTHNLTCINTLNADLNPICHLVALLGAHHFLHLSGIRVNAAFDLYVVNLRILLVSRVYSIEW